MIHLTEATDAETKEDAEMTNTTKITAAAIAEATRLCDNGLRAIAELPYAPALVERSRRYQLAEFNNVAKCERIVGDILRGADGEIAVGSREELLDAVAVYRAVGAAEVARRFIV